MKHKMMVNNINKYKSIDTRAPSKRPFSFSKKKRTVVLAIMMSGTTAACISQSMMIAALPAIMQEFSVNASLAQLLTTAYIFVLGLIAALTAFLVHRIDAKKLFIAAMICFIIGCLGSIIASNYPVLLISRIIQAVGSGISLPLVQVVALSLYPRSEYGHAMGLVGLIIGFAPALGPAISGVLIDAGGWRLIFVVLGLLTMVVIGLAISLITKVVTQERVQDRFEVRSALMYTLGFCAVMVGVTLVESRGHPSILMGVLVLGGAGVLALFVRTQLRIAHPLLKLTCFANRTFTVSLVLVLVAQVGFVTGSIMVPLFVQDIQGGSATVSGITILPGALLLGILNPLTGKLIDRHGPRPLIVAGSLILIGGTLAFVLCGKDTPQWLVTTLYGIRMVGVACLMMPMTAYACAALPTCDIAQGTAIITSLRQIFGALASSALIAVMSLISSNPLGIDGVGFSVSFLVQAGVIVVGFVAGMLLLPRTSKRQAG